MLYSDLYFRSKRRTSLLLIGMAVFAVSLFTFFLFQTSVSTPTKAVKRQLKRHEIVNISSKQVAIFWQSDIKEASWVIYGDTKQNLNKTALDDRDLTTNKIPAFFHLVYLKNLTENTTYYYKIVTKEGVIAKSDGEPFEITTTKVFPIATSLKPAYGKVILPNGQPATNAYILIHYRNAFPLAAVSKITGEWLIPLQQLVDKESRSAESVIERDKISIEIFNEEGVSTVINALVKRTTPLPQTIVLGKNYTFFEEDNVLPASTSIDNGRTYPLTILFPKENAVIPGNKPLLKGLAIPGSDVKIRLNSQPGYIFNVKADREGQWNASIPNSIPAGTYTLSVLTQDKNDNPVTLHRVFSIGKSGESVLGEATPSGTVTTAPTATPTTATTSITPAVTSEPSFTPTPTITGATVTLTPTQPVSGFNTQPFLFGSIALLVLGAGVLFVF